MKNNPVQAVPIRKEAMRRTRNRKTVDTSAGPLLNQEPDGNVRFLRGAHKGKALSDIPKRDLTTLLNRSHAFASDAELLLNEHLTREYGRPMTAKTALSAMQADWEEMKSKMDAASQEPSLSDRLFATLAERIGALAHEADTWPLSPPDVR